jgi:N6-L-threonylcarbamoyladenine synthase
VHHLEGHLYSPFLDPEGGPARPVPETFHGLVVSGGHTALYRVEGDATTTLAETRDDAMGEIFDKIGKRLGLPYPQGPIVDELAERGDPTGFRLPIARCSDGSNDFSYSGLKSRTLLEIEKLEAAGTATDLSIETEQPMLDLLAGFRVAAAGQVLDRLNRFRRGGERVDLLAVSGGAAANRLLRRELTTWAAEHQIDLRLVPLRYAGDNAAMIAHTALVRERQGRRDDPLEVDAASRIPL